MVNLIIIIFCLIGIPLSITLGIKCLRAYDRSESTISFVGFVCLTFVVPIILFLLLLWTVGDLPYGW
jgi:ABC-type antimicrobial peptide transport system permease subunit